MYPDFLIIGAQKAGTTWLHRNLQAHPGIWMPKEKELHYFDEKLDSRGSLLSKVRGTGVRDRRWRRQLQRQLKSYRKIGNLSSGNLKWDLRYFFWPTGDEWYASLFKPGQGKITGEATPDYSIVGRDTVARVHALMPEAKIIFIMRNPIERVWSSALMALRDVAGEPTDEEFHQRFRNRKTALFTDYLRTLDNWSAFYPPERIFVGFLEDVHFYPEGLLERLYSFLGADPGADYRVITRKIHTRSVERMPVRFAAALAASYAEEIKHLDESFGGYASFWRYCAGRLTGDTPPEENIEYPLWESRLWEEWRGSSGEPSRTEGVKSGPLSSVRAAR